jgi:hypothetical protein
VEVVELGTLLDCLPVVHLTGGLKQSHRGC